MKLTKKAIDRMRYEGDGQSRDVRWDDQLSGFGVRIYPSGKKGFVLSYRSRGRKRLMSLGGYGEKTLEQAQKKARSLLGAIADGKDPLQEKHKQARGQKMKALCSHFLEEYAKPTQKTWKTMESRINKYIIPAVGGLQISAVNTDDIKALHKKISKNAPIEANRVIALVSAMLTRAAKPEWGFVDEKHVNPCRGFEMNKETERNVWVRPDEFPKLAESIDKEPNIYVRAILWAYLLTGCRKSELLRAKRDNIDHFMKELKLEDTKSGKPQIIQLNGPAYTLLTELPPLDGNPYLFPGRKAGRPLVNIDKAWRRVRKEAKLEGVWLHDLRRTVGSWLANSGKSLHLIGQVLRHSKTETTKIYARLAEDSTREALEAHGKQIMGIAGKGPVAEVVELQKRTKKKKKAAR